MSDQSFESECESFADCVRIGMEQLERGECVEYDEAGLRELFEKLKQRAKNRISDNTRRMNSRRDRAE